MSLNPNLYASLSGAPEPTEVTAQYVWGTHPGHRDELILRDRDTGGGSLDERLYCLMDYFDPTAVIDPAGAVVERYGWSAFGQRRVMDADWAPLASSAVAFDFAFHGQFLDSDTGYYNYGYRYYSPEIGRWLSRDPIAEIGGLNVYSYSTSNPTNTLDKFGLKVTEFDADPETYPVKPNDSPQNFPPSEKRFGVTVPWWSATPSRKPKGDQCELKVTGNLLILAYWNSKVFSSEMAAQATINHERVHVKIFKENWNSFKAAADSWDGYMDKCCCVDFAWELVIGLEEIWKGHAYIENGKFDKLAYGGGEKIIELGEKHLARGEKLVNDSIVKLIDNQCSFSASSF